MDLIEGKRARILRELYNLLSFTKSYKEMHRIVISNPNFYNLDVKATNTLRQPECAKLDNGFGPHIVLIGTLLRDLKIDTECAEKFAFKDNGTSFKEHQSCN